MKILLIPDGKMSSKSIARKLGIPATTVQRHRRRLEKEFLTLAKQNNMVGIKGHRSVGGFRASLYNALPLSSVELLTDLMKDFAQRKG